MSAVAYTTPAVGHSLPGTESLYEKVSARNLDFYYGDNRALKNINVALFQGHRTTRKDTGFRKLQSRIANGVRSSSNR